MDRGDVANGYFLGIQFEKSLAYPFLDATGSHFFMRIVNRYQTDVRAVSCFNDNVLEARLILVSDECFNSSLQPFANAQQLRLGIVEQAIPIMRVVVIGKKRGDEDDRYSNNDRDLGAHGRTKFGEQA